VRNVGSYGPILLLSAAILALAVSVALAARQGTAALLGQAQNHTNLLLALSIVWIYLEATTLIIVWGADFPHEVEFYLKRLQGPWDGVAALWVAFFRLVHLAWYLLPALGRGVGEVLGFLGLGLLFAARLRG
jgi:hypothetical protein